MTWAVYYYQLSELFSKLWKWDPFLQGYPEGWKCILEDSGDHF
jgi:hypothetical protein